MKVLAVVLLCAFSGGVAGGVVTGPNAGAPTFPTAAENPTIPGEMETTQYFNAIPASYMFGFYPPVFFPLAHAGGFPSFQPNHRPVVGSPFVSDSTFGASGFGPSPIVSGVNAGSGSPFTRSRPFDTGLFSGMNSLPQGNAQNAPGLAYSQPEKPVPHPSGLPTVTAPQASHASPHGSGYHGLSALPLFPTSNASPNFPSIMQSPYDSSSFPSKPDNTQNGPQVSQFQGLPQFPQLPSHPFSQGLSQSPHSNFPLSTNSGQGQKDEVYTSENIA